MATLRDVMASRGTIETLMAGGPGSGRHKEGGSTQTAPHPKLQDAHDQLTKHGYQFTRSTPMSTGSQYSAHPNNQNYHYEDGKGNHVLLAPSPQKAEYGGKLGMWQHTNTSATPPHASTFKTGNSTGLTAHLNKFHGKK